eukprot:TRINITY_DN237_c0_g1_i4.p1 TRINITY_DN237_c0_g1~~TRINITY_DN237_c0_g1_i4.p1  ORF type:complete len:538 (-),score=114.47 TRINITY_DN237_c0_g1_i4:101-1714(-)
MKEAYKIAENICEKEAEKFECQAQVDLLAPRFLHSYLYHFFDPFYQCGSQNLCDDYEELKVDDFKKRVLADMPTPQKTPVQNKSRYKILHITDTHIEFDYIIGNEAKCKTQYCCVSDSGKATNNETAAGKWGTTKGQCDIPLQTMEEALKYISEVHKPEIILWTGDSYGHIAWRQVKEHQTDAMKYISGLIDKYFISQGVQVYPMWGNHESFPLDEFDYYGNDTQYLKDTAYDIWKNWIPKDAIESLQKRGFYSLKNEKYKFKLITLLTEVFDILDFHIIKYPTNPLNELEWLESELREAESSGYTVIIQGHIPVGECIAQSQWSRRYNILIQRFQNIIRGQFFGHTHYDQFQIIRSQDEKQAPVSYTLTSPCLTGGNSMPTFREYEFDRDTNALLNIQAYRLDIDKANKDQATSLMNYWFKAYDFVEYYKFKDYITLDQMANLVEQFATDKNLLKKYVFNYYQGHQSLEMIEKKIVNDTQGYFQKLRYCEAKYAVYKDIFECAKDATTIEPFFEIYEYISDYSNVWYQAKKKAQQQ